MNTQITGYMSSEVHEKHLRILNFCKKEGISCPEETAFYFTGDKSEVRASDVDEEEIEEKLEISLSDCLSDCDSSQDMEDRWEIDVKKIPEDVTIIRISNLY